MTSEETQKIVRISKSADEKLQKLAKLRHLSKSKIATRIIAHYYSENVGVDLPQPDEFRAVVTTLVNQATMLSKVVGSQERTESFIKGLLREDRAKLPLHSDADNASEDDTLKADNDQRLTAALSIIEQLISSSHEIPAVDGRPVMQIRLQLQKYNLIKTHYEKLCM